MAGVIARATRSGICLRIQTNTVKRVAKASESSRCMWRSWTPSLRQAVTATPYVRKPANVKPPLPAKAVPARPVVALTTPSASAAPRAPAPPPPSPQPQFQPKPDSPATQDLGSGFDDALLDLDPNVDGNQQVDWTRSFYGLSTQPFSQEAAEILMAPIPLDDIEVKPDGIIYLPEIKYRRILNRAFGPGGWGLAPRGETIVTEKSITREYALVAHGRLVSVARGEQDYFTPEGIPTATEGCKSNALMRCCKDLGVASELWDPRYIRRFMKEHAKQIWAEHVTTKKKKQIWLRRDDDVRYPFKEFKFGS